MDAAITHGDCDGHGHGSAYGHRDLDGNAGFHLDAGALADGIA